MKVKNPQADVIGNSKSRTYERSANKALFLNILFMRVRTGFHRAVIVDIREGPNQYIYFNNNNEKTIIVVHDMTVKESKITGLHSSNSISSFRLKGPPNCRIVSLFGRGIKIFLYILTPVFQ